MLLILFLISGKFNISSIEGLSSGFKVRHFFNRSFISEEYSEEGGAYIPLLILLQNKGKLWSLKGILKVSNSYKRTPKAHISLFVS